jgi:hypothetical protein
MEWQYGEIFVKNIVLASTARTASTMMPPLELVVYDYSIY